MQYNIYHNANISKAMKHKDNEKGKKVKAKLSLCLTKHHAMEAYLGR